MPNLNISHQSTVSFHWDWTFCSWFCRNSMKWTFRPFLTHIELCLDNPQKLKLIQMHGGGKSVLVNLNKCFFSKTGKCKFGNLERSVSEQIYWWGCAVKQQFRETRARYLQLTSSHLGENFRPAMFDQQLFSLKHLTSNKCLLERPCIVNSKHLQTQR